MTAGTILKTCLVFVAGAAAAVAVTNGRGALRQLRIGIIQADVQMARTAEGKQANKNRWHCGMHPWVIKDEPGDCPICHMKLTPMHPDLAADSSAAPKKPIYYWDPMLGPSSISDRPGKSAMNMDSVPVYAESDRPKVTIDPTIVQNMGVLTAEVTRGPLNKTVRTVGMLKSPESGMYDVSLKVGGWIDKLDANQEGMHVLKGEPLLELYSQDLQVAEEELISAVSAERSMSVDASLNVRQEATSLVELAKRKLRLWDVADEDIEAIAKSTRPPKDVPFRSPASGHIVEKMVVQGTAVQPGVKLMRIEDHTTMWLDVQVYEEQLSVVKIGQQVLAVIDGVPGKTFKGRITFMYPHIDQLMRTLTVRMTLENPEFELKPGMYATADIVTQPLQDAIQAPREAVIDTGTRQFAFVAKGEGHFDPRSVRMGATGDNDRVQIVEGLVPGEFVVTSGQFLMDVESRTTEAIDKLRKTSVPATDHTTGTDSMTGMPMSGTPMTTELQRGPMTSAMADSLMVAYCPMKKTNWLQQGNRIANPYFGSSMINCGEVIRQFTMPASGSDLEKVVAAYLEVAKALDVDNLDVSAIATLKSSVNLLSSEKYAALKQSAAVVAGAKSLTETRLSFELLSKHLISALEQSAM